MADPLPRSDTAMLDFTRAWADQFASDAASFGVSEEDAASYIAAQAHFAECYAVWAAAATRTKISLTLKDEARRALEQQTRSRLVQIRARVFSGTVTPGQLRSLGVGPDRRANPRIADWPLAGAPVLSVSILREGVVRVRVLEAVESTRRTWPPGVRGLLLSRAIEHRTTSPDPTDWPMVETSSRMVFDVELDDHTLRFGTRVWFVARWSDPHRRRTPFSQAQMIRTTWEGPLRIGQNLAA